MKFDDIIKQVEDNPCAAFFYTPSLYKKALSYLFIKPLEIISVYKKEDLDYAFKVIHKLIDKGFYGYSLINYEAGFLFEEKLINFISGDNEKLIQFFFFDRKEVHQLKSSKIIFNEFSRDKYSVTDFKLNRSETQFFDDIKKIKHYIKEGDTYQVNYTVKGRFEFTGSYSVFFQKLLFNQSAKYSAFINNDEKFIISLSPELFFQTDGKKINSAPMKGTIRRGFNHGLDALSVKELETGDKNKAENVMIVDLIRNDFGRICRYGSVTVPELFQIEKYESLFQMVSEVEGKLRKKTMMLEILQNIFPCGSVTGAPKIRTMEIINEIEKEKRGIYTGSIGLLTPKELKMNVAIRTITIKKSDGDGAMGLGSGIVWDSNPLNEYEEVNLKSKFLTEPFDYFEIFETMRCENGEIKFLDDHLTRIKSAADYFLFKFNEKKIRKQLAKSIAGVDKLKIKKIKLSLTKWGEIRIDVSDIPNAAKNISAIISQSKIDSTDKFRYFKTTNRKLYDDEYASFCEKGFYEVIYFNERNELAEGSRTNIFIRKSNTWFTPKYESGALPGIYRKYFIGKNSEVSEKTFNVDDLLSADELLLTNALRGEVIVQKLYITPDEYITYKK
ncbi:MAG TPA: aminodeoxychorismate synthase component I [Ignavibacteriaceae bacterium]|nr:aminodeoxychorismate synthase component I [Ignavibacteriaceae bacterium]